MYLKLCYLISKIYLGKLWKIVLLYFASQYESIFISCTNLFPRYVVNPVELLFLFKYLSLATPILKNLSLLDETGPWKGQILVPFKVKIKEINLIFWRYLSLWYLNKETSIISCSCFAKFQCELKGEKRKHWTINYYPIIIKN